MSCLQIRWTMFHMMTKGDVIFINVGKGCNALLKCESIIPRQMSMKDTPPCAKHVGESPILTNICSFIIA